MCLPLCSRPEFRTGSLPRASNDAGTSGSGRPEPEMNVQPQGHRHMTTETCLPRPFRRLQASVRTVIFIALAAIAPVLASADQHASTAPGTRIADVSLADLDLSGP